MSWRFYPETVMDNHWWVDHMFMIAPAAGYIGEWLQSFRDFPPRQKPGSFNLDRVMESITKGAGDKYRLLVRPYRSPRISGRLRSTAVEPG